MAYEQAQVPLEPLTAAAEAECVLELRLMGRVGGAPLRTTPCPPAAGKAGC